jgi:hypothetical protein
VASVRIGADNPAPKGITMTLASKPDFLTRWRRWRAVVSFVDALFKSRRVHVSAIDR